jgi:S-adenosylmethionine:tRNA ribosyltransferase-isomerase
MHSEAFTISAEAADRINAAAADGRPVVAVGTTSARALESAFDGNAVASGEAATSLFIYPGYTFRVVGGMITNFHTPASSLLMLAAAFADKNGCGKTGRDLILESYACALREGYRFFSYGDAMLIR